MSETMCGTSCPEEDEAVWATVQPERTCMWIAWQEPFYASKDLHAAAVVDLHSTLVNQSTIQYDVNLY